MNHELIDITTTIILRIVALILIVAVCALFLFAILKKINPSYKTVKATVTGINTSNFNTGDILTIKSDGTLGLLYPAGTSRFRRIIIKSSLDNVNFYYSDTINIKY